MKNLELEMVRFGVSNYDIQRILGCSPKTINNKLAERTEFSLDEAMKIRDAFFRGMQLEYLFAREEAAAPQNRA